MSSDNIYESFLTLRLKDRYYEWTYQQNRYSKLKKHNIVLSCILVIVSLSLTIALSLDISEMFQNFNSKYVTLMNFSTTILTSINLLLSVIITNKKIQSWITYINYIYILLVFDAYRFYFVRVLVVDNMVFSFIFTVEMFFRKAWFFMGIIDFVPGVYLHVITLVIHYVIFLPISTQSLQFRYSINAGILIITTGIIYFYIKEQKRSFFYYHSMKSKHDWFKNIIDNMNSGFISIEEGEVQYYNNTMMKLFSNKLIKAFSINGKDVCLSINDIFMNIQSEMSELNCFTDVIQLLVDNYQIAGDNFFFLGTQNLQTSPTTTVSLEIYGRCYSSNHSVIDKYEFIFNDITRSKLIEEKNAEFKYKNLFLSKVAHEFKNPLLCIGELVDQIREELDTTDIKTTEILKQIESMSKYLIILVKDLDYFSQKNTGIVKTVEMDYVDLQDLLKFCKDIVTGLIKRSQKQDYIKFDILKADNLPLYLYSDEIKLKQILINILSNSVKYTQSGSIDLSISIYGKNIKFKINDTGKGITEQQKEKLFIPFSNEFDKLNKYSSGLGLSIVKELTELLQSKIEFDSNIGKGSTFWFEIPIGERGDTRATPDPDHNTSIVSEATIKGVHYSQHNLLAYDINNPGVKYIITPRSREHKKLTVIIVDDEIVARQSSIRLMSKYLKEKSFDLTIIDVSDGIECLFKYQLLHKEGRRIDFILSDESMEFMNGSTCADVLKNISEIKNFNSIPYFILSAYECFSKGQHNGVTDVFSKPLRKQNIDDMLKKVTF
jgi:signal transduction histidine kinase